MGMTFIERDTLSSAVPAPSLNQNSAAPVGRISSAAVRRDRLLVGREVRGLRWPTALAGGRCYRARAHALSDSGPRTQYFCAPLRSRAGGGAPRPRRGCRPVADCPQCAPTASRRRAGCGPRHRAHGVSGDDGYPSDPS